MNLQSSTFCRGHYTSLVRVLWEESESDAYDQGYTGGPPQKQNKKKERKKKRKKNPNSAPIFRSLVMQITFT